MFEGLYKWLSHDIGIDLGTANLLVYVRGHGIIINEPSVVAVNKKTGRVVAIGADAKRMIGRTPAHLAAIQPLVHGVISDFEITEELLAYFIRKARELAPAKFLRPRVVIGVPSGITNVERRAVKDAAQGAGARAVYIVEEPMAAAIGVRLPVHEPVGTMVVDIGGGTTDIAVISLSGVVNSRGIHIAGDKLNQEIVTYIRDQFKVLVGERTAEEVKLAISAVGPSHGNGETTVRGRDLVTGLPREVAITEQDIREAIGPSVASMVEQIKEVLEMTPPEVVSDVMHRGIYIVGGGSLIRGMSEMLEEELKIPIHVPEDPLTAVVRGTGVILENLSAYRDVFLDDDKTLPPKQ
ncbi:MAG: rod shape-determining protein [Candidatus Vogelbacteria bacterium]|nr:rod shape-determining protein [Candidatus Vogelbacteria bacterium]